MDKLEGYKVMLKERLTVKRYTHSVAVAQTAAKLAGLFGGNVEQAYLTGLLHDYARDMTMTELLDLAQTHNLITDHAEVLSPVLLHGTVGAYLLREQGIITDPSMLNAISWHTTGHPEMDLLASIIYVADYIEPGRSFPDVEKLRVVAYKDLTFGLLHGLDHTLIYLLQKGAFIHPLSIAARNRIIENINIKNCN